MSAAGVSGTAQLIGGVKRDGSGEILGSWNPSTGALVESFTAASAEDVADAVCAAVDAFKPWSRRSKLDRVAALQDGLGRLRSTADSLAAALSDEIGLPIADAPAEVLFALDAASHACELAALENARPYGAVGVITPWEAPLALPLEKIVSALVVGNTVVWKAPVHAAVVSVKLATAFQELPPGVLNVVLGGNPTAQSLASAPLALLSVTNTASASLWLARDAIQAGIRVQAETAGWGIAAVGADADLPSAADLIATHAFALAGQRSGATKVVVVAGSAYDAFRDELAARVDGLRVGVAADSETDIGPLVDAAAAGKVSAAVSVAEEQGATVVVGRGIDPEIGPNFVCPTLVELRDHAEVRTAGPVLGLLHGSAPRSSHSSTWCVSSLFGSADSFVDTEAADAALTSHGVCPPTAVYETLIGARRASVSGTTARDWFVQPQTVLR